MRRIFVLFFVLILISSTPVLGKSSDSFIDHLSSIVYVGCQEEDLIIKENFIFNTLTDETVTLIPWPYSYENVWSIIEVLGRYEPFDDYANGCDVKEAQQLAGKNPSGWTKGKDGCRILTCGEHKLDINDYEYFWDSIRVDVPKETTNIAINNQGNLVQGLSNCNIKQEQYKAELNNCTIEVTNLNEKINWFSGIANLLISLLGGAILYLYFHPKGDKKRRKKALYLSIGLTILLLIITFAISSGIF